MTEDSQTPEDVEVLLNAFAAAHPRPDARAIAAWVGKYPQAAGQIRELATTLIAEHLAQARAADAARYEKALEHALERGRRKMAEEREEARSSPTTFDHLARARGYDIPSLAELLNVHRVVIGEYVSGRMTLPARARFVRALAECLQVGVDALSAAVDASRLEIAGGLAKYEGAPEPTLRTYDEVVEQSSMSAERKAFWLERD